MWQSADAAVSEAVVRELKKELGAEAVKEVRMKPDDMHLAHVVRLRVVLRAVELPHPYEYRRAVSLSCAVDGRR